MDAVPVSPGRDDAALAALLPWPAADANKYTRGKLCLVAGSAAYPGAAVLAGTAAERAGAGYTEVFCAGRSLLTVRTAAPTLVVRDWRSWRPSRLPAPRPGHPRACVIGCGFDGAGDGAEGLLMETLRAFAGPVLVDGGALGLLACETGLRLAAERGAAGTGPLVLTPHGGEAARLARAVGIEGDGGDPAALAAALAKAYGATVALKGPVTFIAGADGAVEVMDRGTAALAKAGTGDVLAGIVGALLAQGLAPADAAALGCALHAETGRAAAAALTDIGVTAGDLAAHLPAAVRAITHI